MDYATDTHAILWHLFLPTRLGWRAREAFAAADAGFTRVYVPAIVVAEMITIVERGRLPGVTLAALLLQFGQMRRSTNYILLPLTPDTVIASHALHSIPDIFDRLIVAEARRLGLPLLSRDETIAGSGLVTTLWA